MTTREIAEAVGKAEKTVRTWASKASAKSAAMTARLAASTSMHPADWNLEEACAIIETGLGVNTANLFRMSSRKNSSTDRLDRLESMVSQLVGALASIIPAQTKPTVQAIAAPSLSPRDELRQIINDAARESADYPGTWNEFYKAVYYRLHINAKERAKHAKVTALEILDEEELLPQCIAIAREIFA